MTPETRLVYDAGALIAAERSDREMWILHQHALTMKSVPVTTAPVLAQVSRTARPAQLNRLLRGCDVYGFPPEAGRQVGALLHAAGSSDVVDAHLVLVAARLDAIIVTSDPDDIGRLAELCHPRPQWMTL